MKPASQNERIVTPQVPIPASIKGLFHIRAAETGTPMRVLALSAVKGEALAVPIDALVDQREPR